MFKTSILFSLCIHLLSIRFKLCLFLTIHAIIVHTVLYPTVSYPEIFVNTGGSSDYTPINATNNADNARLRGTERNRSDYQMICQEAARFLEHHTFVS